MSVFRTALVSGLALTLVAAAARAETAGVSLRNLDMPGAFEVANSGPEVKLSTRVRVERLARGGWTARIADVRLVRNCDLEPPPACVTLAPDETLRPPPWNGFSCGGQCPSACRANVLAPPGTYRFVIEACGGSPIAFGPPFERR
jgi:hypothetical protein